MSTRFNRFLLKNLFKGIAVGWSLLGLFLLFDVGGVRTLIFNSSNTVMAIGLLMVGFAITFGNCAMGIAVMKFPATKKEEETTS